MECPNCNSSSTKVEVEEMGTDVGPYSSEKWYVVVVCKDCYRLSKVSGPYDTKEETINNLK